MKSHQEIRAGKKAVMYLLAATIIIILILASCGGGGYGGGGGGGSAAPGAFSLVSPVDGAQGTGTTPTFSWTASAYTTGYRVQIDATGLFSGPFELNTTVGATTYNYTVSGMMLSTGVTYYWRVIAENPYGQAITGPRSFTP
jgi:hypothetical protein